MTKLVAPIIASSVSQAREDIRQAKIDGADLVEIRLDYLDDADFPKLVKESPLPIIWTLRHKSEGGKFDGSIENQFETLLAAIESGGEYVDIEYRRWTEAPHLHLLLQKQLQQLRGTGRKIKLIVSFHDFQATPYYISDIAEKIARDPNADVVKIACMINNISENFYIFDLLRDFPKPAIAIGMGPLGAISRILAGKFQAELTFASIEPSKSSAPGQLTIKELLQDYNWKQIGPDTKIAGVIGHPIDHSLSPIMQNSAYEKMKLNVVYLKFDVPKDYANFSLFADHFSQRPDECFGLSVTIPHKTNAIKYIKERNGTVDPLAEKIGAVNTIVIYPDGKLAGFNTDYSGILEALKVVAGLDRSSLAKMKVAVLGAGGVSKAIVAAMVDSSADVTIFNRTELKARKLSKTFSCKWAPWEKRNLLAADIIINGTSLGMTPDEQTCPLESQAIRKNAIVFDAVYNPLETKLLKLAKDAGATVVDGANMLVFQAAEQIKLWLEARNIQNISVPVDIMKKTILTKLDEQD